MYVVRFLANVERAVCDDHVCSKHVVGIEGFFFVANSLVCTQPLTRGACSMVSEIFTSQFDSLVAARQGRQEPSSWLVARSRLSEASDELWKA